ncbi:MAG: AAA family ATPase [Ktedonobacterales bacterium]
MSADLLERDQLLAALHALLRQAAGHSGTTALVSGEAGIGKTALIERFVESQRTTARTLWGGCEALFTPRPLGPLYDIARQIGGKLHTLLEHEPSQAALFSAFFDELHASARPTIVVFEDVHWADEATLDLIKFLGRRVHQLAVLFVATYRNDELGKDHPLRSVVGDLPARNVARLSLPPLSESAVMTLARQTHRPAADLYAATGGNPFFVTEVLAAGSAGVPVTVSDAVLARVARLSAAARTVVELAAVVPARVEQETLDAILGPGSPGLEECLTAGILRSDGAAVAFRHELARQAIEVTLSPVRQRALHGQVLQTLLERSTPPTQAARLVHHATHVGDSTLVLRLAPLAARESAARGAHREAAAHYATALRHAEALGLEPRAELLEGLAHECYLTSQMERAVRAREEALAIWRQLGKTDMVAHNYRRLSRLHWFLGHRAEAEHYAHDAVQVLEQAPPGAELAMAYSNRAQLYMLADDVHEAQLWGGRAIALAEELDDQETLCHALNNVGSAELNAGDARGREKLERSLRIALDGGFEEHVARAYTNLAEHAVMFRDYARAADYHARGLAYCMERDLDSWGQYMRGWRARERLEQGDWVGADEDATAVLSVPQGPAAIRIPALITLGLVRARRGDPAAWPLLDEARELALATGEQQRIAPMAAARAEAAWLRGRSDQCRQEAQVGFAVAVRHRNPWALGELASWLWRVGDLSAPPRGSAEPYALQIAGDWRAAAAAWERVGCPYERALALAEGDEAAQRAALVIFDRLEAGPAAETVRQRLRARGARGIPRGPRPATRDNPSGLTNRQLEVLALMVAGLHNVEIAERLSTSPKTVEHHVSAVLDKLQVQSRTQAIAEAHRLNLVASQGGGRQA